MATYTDNYQLTKPTYAEQADIGVINSNMNKIDEIMHSSQISLADAYDSTKTYAEGDVVMYELLMYKCLATTTGNWDASKWERTTASESGGGGSAELDILGEGSGAVVSFADGASAELVKCIAEIVPKQAGSGTPSPTNVRAISGHSSVDISVIGKNLVNELHNGAISSVGGYTTPSTRVSNATSETSSKIKVTAGKYTISGDGLAYATVLTKDNEGNIVDNFAGSWNEMPYTFTITQTANLYFTCRKSDGTASINPSDVKVQIESGETATAIEPYANIVNIQLGQTVYGGQLNVLTGELIIDRIRENVDDYDWTLATGNINRFYTSAIPSNIKKPTAQSRVANIISDRYKTDSFTALSDTDAGIAVNTNGRINITNNAYSDPIDFKTAMAGVPMVYELETPFTYTLTPQEVNSLLGQNNISADTGDIDIVYVKASAPIQPNPTGTPTATLKKLGIEGTVFELEGGGGGSSSGINYSTTEQVIGTWIDGKPLYQKVITTSNVSGGGSIDITSLSIETAFIFGGYVHLTGGANISLNEYLDTGYYTYCHINGNQIDYKLSGYTGSYTIIIQYTKITD